MNTEFAIDWFSVTAELPTLPLPGVLAYPLRCRSGWAAARASNGYTEAYRNEIGTLVQWNAAKPSMRAQVTYSGTVLARYREAGENELNIVRWHCQRSDRVTRIDFAFDVRDSGLNIDVLYEELKSGSARTLTTKHSIVHSTGVTLYVGSRESERFLRVYDKAAEMSVPGDWIRIEVEIKGEKARQLGKILAYAMEHQVISIARSLVSAHVMFANDIWKRVLGENEPVKLTASKKERMDFKNWLANQVAPAIAKYIARGGDRDIIDQLTAMVNHKIDIDSRRW